MKKPALAPFPLVAVASLLVGLLAGLVRMGFDLPLPHDDLLQAHGPLMVCGFLGTVIGVERAVALGSAWGFLVPAANAFCAIALLVPALGGLAAPAVTLGGVGLVAVFGAILRRQVTMAIVLMVAGALAFAVGGLLWWGGQPLSTVALWWIAFLLLTIAGERLELARFLALRRRPWGLLGPLAVVVVGAVLASVAGLQGAGVHEDRFGTYSNSALFTAGMRAIGAGLVGVALWLLICDVARRNVRIGGLQRFVGLTLLAGYVWLGLAGIALAVLGGVVAGIGYDAALHAFFLGFVFTMIFAHAPLILPGVLGVTVAFRPRFYAHVVLLHGALVLRIYGDLTAWLPGRRWGGMLSAVAILVFFASTAIAVVQTKLQAQGSTPGAAGGS